MLPMNLLPYKEMRRKVKVFQKENAVLSYYYFGSTFLLWILAQILIITFEDSYISIILAFILVILNVRMFAIFHDYVHGAILKKSHLANVFFTFFSIYSLSPKSIWRKSHNYHHAKNTILDHIAYGSYKVYSIDKFEALSNSEKKWYLFERSLIVSIFGHFFMFLINFCVVPLFSKKHKHYDSLIALIIYFILLILAITTNNFYLWLVLYFIPLFIFHAIGTIFFYIQHNFSGARVFDESNWTLEASALNSTSYIKMGSIFNWITANIGYHHVHHLNSSIPFYNLKKAHECVLQYAKPIEIKFDFKTIYKAYQLKVYDPDTQMLVKL